MPTVRGMSKNKIQAICSALLVAGLSAIGSRAQEPQAPPPAAAQSSKPPAAAKPAERQIPPAIAKLLGMPPPEDPAAVERGEKTFVTRCAFCHGSGATGGEGGPDLVRSVLVLDDEKGNKIGPVVLEGRPQKGMPKFPLSQAQITDIAAFLHAQAQKKANRMAYQIQNVVTGDPKAGESYFEAHCQSCHSPTGDLAGVANKFDPVALQSRFLYPKTFTYPGMPQHGAPPPPTRVKVTLADGTSFSGDLKHMDSFSVSLYDSNGDYHSWLKEQNPGMKVEVDDPLAGHVALLAQYSDADMHNILAYLETLK